jgi:hypothetical protein
MSHVAELPLRPAQSRRLHWRVAALFVAAAVVVVLLLLANPAAKPVPDRSIQCGASAAEYQHPRAAPVQYLHSGGEDARCLSR